MIFPNFIAFLTCCAIATFLNGLGLFLLFNCNNSEIDLTQRYILINLCFIDLNLSLVYAIDRILFVLNAFDVLSSSYYKFTLGLCMEIVNTGYYFATFWLIIDRYLHIKLNIRYVIYWSKMKTIIATIFLWMLMTLIGSLFTVYLVKYELVIYVVFDSIIVTFSSYVYVYALILFKKQKANIRSNQQNNSIFKGLVLSVVIVTAFTVLVVIPDALNAVYNFDYNENLPWYMWIVYPISLWTDALVYILLSPKVRLTLKNKLKCVFNKSVTRERSELYHISS